MFLTLANEEEAECYLTFRPHLINVFNYLSNDFALFLYTAENEILTEELAYYIETLTDIRFRCVLNNNFLLDDQHMLRNHLVVEKLAGKNNKDYFFVGSEIAAFKGIEERCIPICKFFGNLDDDALYMFEDYVRERELGKACIEGKIKEVI